MSASLTKCDSVIIEGVMDYHGQKQEWLIPCMTEGRFVCHQTTTV
ncbi:MAG: hypothetical protein PHE70_12030 [Tepidanaerobacteraceae bacterium]|nr:hypothetical protein [Tepidanaerobacteraceae bacterium]